MKEIAEAVILGEDLKRTRHDGQRTLDIRRQAV
jgi:hypothetical protein